MSRTAIIISIILKSFFSLIFVLFAITSFTWTILWMGALLTGLTYLIWTKRKSIFTAILVVSIISLPLAFNQISNRMDYLGNLIRNQGSQSLNTFEKVSIYSGNIAMAVGGFAIFAPEVAIETLLLIDPRGKDKTFNSDFAMGSKHVRNIIEEYSIKVKNGSGPLKSERIPLRWGSGYNSYSMFDYRVALAVAGGGLFLDYEKTNERYKVKCRITINVKYSEDYKLDILNHYGVRLYIDEAIFTALQELGWFHPYYAHYHWSIDV